LLFIYYDFISQHYTGWNLTEIKNMPAAERDYWVSTIKWRSDRNAR
jgi:hypothetical protein